MKHFRVILLTLAMLFSAVTSFAQTLSFATDFSTAAPVESELGRFVNPQRLSIATAPDGAGKALILERGKTPVTFLLASNLGEKDDCAYSFEYTRLSDEASMCFGFENAQHQATGMLFITPQGRLMYRNEGKYSPISNVILKTNKRYTIKVSLSRDTQRAEVVVEGVGAFNFPAYFYPELSLFIFSPQAPNGNRNAVEHFRLERRPSRIVSRENGVLNTPIELRDGKLVRGKLTQLVDGKFDSTVELAEKCTLYFPLPRRINAVALQLYGGNLKSKSYPSGACAPRRFIIEGLSNGAWVTLVEEHSATDVCEPKDGALDERFVRYDFKPTTIDQLRMRFEESYDTGMRTSGAISPDQRAMHLREIEVLTDQRIEAKKTLSELIALEYRLPVYQNPTHATLTLIASESSQTPKDGTLSLYSPEDKLLREEKINWNFGKNTISIDDLGDYPAGRYRTVLNTPNGHITRMLRIERVPAVAEPTAPLAMQGKKLFFTPDSYALASCEQLDVTVFPPEMRELVRTPSPDKLLLIGNQFYHAMDGRYIIRVTDRKYHNGALFGDPSQRILAADKIDGPYAVINTLPEADNKYSVVLNQPFYPSTFPKPPAGTKFEFYDAAKHGEIPLGNLSYVYSYKKEDYGCVHAAPRTYWVTGKTHDGKWVMMRQKHLFMDNYYFDEDEYEDGFSTNDNFGGMWLSKDGKELFWAQGQVLKRSAPYVLPYDNLQTGIRMLTIYSTRDGINWQIRNSLTAPNETDSEVAQHYGVMLIPMANADLVLGYLYTYDSVAQQIYIELIYSRDGVDFHRFPGAPPFCHTTEPSEWYFGHIFVNANIIREGNYYYQQASYCTQIPHFACEVVFHAKDLQAVTAEQFRTRFATRGLEERWPYFQKVGGYEGLAKLAHQSYYSAGSLKFRADGWFGLKTRAGKTGNFETRLLTGGKTLYANAELLEHDGEITLSLVNANGKVLKTTRLTGNDCQQKAFALPNDGGAYCIRGTMKNAVLYTLQID